MAVASALLPVVLADACAEAGGPTTDFDWNAVAPGDGAYEIAINWSPFDPIPPGVVLGPPGSGGMATFNLINSTYTVTFNSSPTNARCRIGDNHVLFALNGNTYTLLSTSTTDQSLLLGGLTSVDIATLTLSNGTLAGQHATLGPVNQTTSSVLTVDAGAMLNLAGTLGIGRADPGTLVIQNGGDVGCATALVGELNSGNGSLSLSGTDSTLTTNDLYVGGSAAIDGGSGVVAINPGAVVTVDGQLKLWTNGVINLQGGELEVQTWVPPIEGFNWTSGTLDIGNLDIDSNGLFGDSLLIDAGKTLWTAGLTVGESGFGALTVTDGGHVAGGTPVIGALNGSVGQLVVDGAGALWSGVVALVGGEGNAEVTISGGAACVFDQAIIIGSQKGAVGNLMVAGGGVDTNNISIGDDGIGTLSVMDGGFVNSHGVTFIGAHNDGTLCVDGQDSSLHCDDSVHVGRFFSSHGSLYVNNGGFVHCDFGHIGTAPTATGEVVIDGNDSIWSSVSQLLVGDEGAGLLVVVNGGFATAPSISVGQLGEIQGDGLLISSVSNNGVVAPGAPIGTLQVEGHYAQSELGGLHIEFASADSHDQLVVDNVATLAGTISVEAVEGFKFAQGESFTILTAETIAGTFSELILPADTGLEYTPTEVVLVVLCPADLFPFEDGDGVVGAGDLAVLLASWGPCGAPCPADLAPSGAPDGIVGAADLAQVLASWGICR